MASTAIKFNLGRTRTYLFRLPFFTRFTILIVILLWITSLPLPWLMQWGALIPNDVTIFSGMLVLASTRVNANA